MIVADFDRCDDHVYVYVDREMIASYWGVAGLKKRLDRYVVIDKKGHWIGRITEKAFIKETW